jgi:hypothetical protein
MLALGDRAGAAGTQTYVGALSDRSLYVWFAAAKNMRDHGDERGADAFFVWADRRLGKSNRLVADSADDIEVQALVKYAMRIGRTTEAARLLRRHQARLMPYERDWLSMVWPAALDRDHASGAQSPGPDPGLVDVAVHPDHRSSVVVPFPDEELLEHIRGVVRQLNRQSTK